MKNKLTKDLSESEYNGIPLSIPDVIKSHLNKEEARWFPVEKPVLPKFEPIPKTPKGIAGIYNFVATTLRELRV